MSSVMGRPFHPVKLGDHYNKFVVVGEPFTDVRTKNRNKRVLCKCSCGKDRVLRVADLVNGKRTSCGCDNIRRMKRKEYAKNGLHNPLWRGTGQISGTFWCNLKNGAQNRRHSFTITPKYAHGVFELQHGICTLSGVPLSFGLDHPVTERSPFKTASLDRIDSSKGYIIGNVQWLHKVVNLMKQRLSNEALISWCARLVDYDNNSVTAPVESELLRVVGFPGQNIVAPDIGSKIAHLAVVGKAFIELSSTNTYQQILCKCDCGTEKVFHLIDLIDGRVGSCGMCKYSSSQKLQACYRQKHHSWRGVGEIGKSYWCDLETGAKKRKLAFEIMLEYASELFEIQRRSCALTGLPLKFSVSKDRAIDQTVSLDRIDPSIGYVPGNVQWVHKLVNLIKQQLTNKELILWSRRIADNSALRVYSGLNEAEKRKQVT